MVELDIVGPYLGSTLHGLREFSRQEDEGFDGTVLFYFGRIVKIRPGAHEGPRLVRHKR